MTAFVSSCFGRFGAHYCSQNASALVEQQYPTVILTMDTMLTTGWLQWSC